MRNNLQIVNMNFRAIHRHKKHVSAKDKYILSFSSEWRSQISMDKCTNCVMMNLSGSIDLKIQ